MWEISVCKTVSVGHPSCIGLPRQECHDSITTQGAFYRWQEQGQCIKEFKSRSYDDGMRKVKIQLEFKLPSDNVDNKRTFYTIVLFQTSKENGSLLVREDGDFSGCGHRLDWGTKCLPCLRQDLWPEAEFKEEDDQMWIRIESGVTGEISSHARPPWLTPSSMANIFTRSQPIIFKRLWRLERPLTNEERQILYPFSKRYNRMIQETRMSSVSL